MQGLRIAAKQRNGFWRAGVKHPFEGHQLPRNRFTEEQLEALFDESMLTVEEVDLPDPEPAPKK